MSQDSAVAWFESNIRTEEELRDFLGTESKGSRRLTKWVLDAVASERQGEQRRLRSGEKGVTRPALQYCPSCCGADVDCCSCDVSMDECEPSGPTFWHPFCGKPLQARSARG